MSSSVPLRTRAAAAVAGAAAVFAFSAVAASADGLPAPLPPLPPLPSAPALPVPALPALPSPLPSLPLTGGAPTAPSAPALPSAPTGLSSVLPLDLHAAAPLVANDLPAPLPKAPTLPQPPAGNPLPAQLLDPLVQLSTGVKSGIDQLGSALADTPLSPLAPSSKPAGLVDVTVDATPIATACVQATGTGTALANLDLTLLGSTVSKPATDALPGVVAPCPAGSIPVTLPGSAGSGDPVVDVDAGLGDLLGACVRISSTVAPVQSTIMLLDQNLIQALTKAGLPLDRLVIACPAKAGAGSTTPAGSSPGRSTPGGSGGSDGGGNGGSSANGPVPVALASDGSLPVTGSDLAPWAIAAALLLLGGGTLMVVTRRRAGAMS